MTNRLHPLAARAVETFKSTLSDTTRAQITNADFERLAVIISEALSEQITDAAELVESTARQIRSQIQRPDMDL